MRRFIAACVVAPLLVVLAYRLVTDVFITEETKIERQIHKGRKAVENESILTVASLVAEDYRDKYGHDRSELLAGLRSFFQTTDGLQISITEVHVTVDDTGAEAFVRFSISGVLDGQRFEGLGSNGAETVWLRFTKRDGSWQVIEAAWADDE